ncbi:tRNAIle-lysidine synthetase [Asticcacaulis biprosthecium C19]|uniref:tRNA(Ile)-lysidine synthase n=1 Tax=Asticcacaulis biprosthecium C19 TaxID=715226 RepID=F4QKR3_9CAUL|nr:tRNA lysidine(34) synthetase TilS [Asticcacaulis biprosthecium]EGF93365.1 tRNAIle-lysidine synthetase [Asticcacaulis biprosthecium C19]
MIANRPTVISDFSTLLNGDGPIGVAVSGGGDSVALLYQLADWGRRPLHVFHVDHALQADSGLWADAVAAHAKHLKLSFTRLTWSGDKPTTGISAAARGARHALLAEAARAAGIKVVCLAHTCDDVAEAAYMRQHGSNVGTPQTWSPSPVWPHGRGVFLCRPLLSARRADLRQYLMDRKLSWIDDPANENAKSLRVQARQALLGLTSAPLPPPVRLPRGEVETLLHDPEGWSALGLLRFKADAFYQLPNDTALHLLATAAVCAGGGDRLPRRHKVETLYESLADGRSHTLAGARIRQAGGFIHVLREAGDIGRNAEPGQGDLWDGRFQLLGRVVATGRDRGRLDDRDRAFLRTLPPDLRASLPAMEVSGPHLALPLYGLPGQKHNETVTTSCWVLPRLLASVCRIERETDL